MPRLAMIKLLSQEGFVYQQSSVFLLVTRFERVADVHHAPGLLPKQASDHSAACRRWVELVG